MKMNWQDNFEELYKKQGGQKYGIRLLALWKIQAGVNQTEVCRLLGKTHKTIQSWRHLYESGGVDALLSMRTGRGRKAGLSDAKDFAQSLEELASRQNGGRLRGPDIVEMVEQKYNLRYSLSGMYHVLHRLGFSWITARSKHPRSNPEEQTAFKKTL